MCFLSSFEIKSYYVAHTGLDLALKPTYVHFEGLRLLSVTINSTCFLSYVGPTYYVCACTWCVFLFVCLCDKAKRKTIEGDEENLTKVEDGAGNGFHAKGKARRRQC